jgi:hypothetical protein
MSTIHSALLEKRDAIKVGDVLVLRQVSVMWSHVLVISSLYLTYYFAFIKLLHVFSSIYTIGDDVLSH